MSEIDLDIELKSIKSQVKRNPLSKEDSKKQFVELTNKLDLKHSFDFEEAWEVAQELRKRKEYRNKVLKFEEEIKNIDGVLVGKDLHNANPTKHTFADGCYIREIFNPAGLLSPIPTKCFFILGLTFLNTFVNRLAVCISTFTIPFLLL